MDKYLQYNHFELAEDPSFIRWAKGSESRDDLDWDAWLENNSNRADIVVNAKTLVLAMKFKEDASVEGIENQVWNKISSDISEKDVQTSGSIPKRSRLIKLLPYAAVAAVALLFFIFNLGNDFDTTVNVPYATTENITLPDGSMVMVNADSRLEYNKKKWKDKRTVFLQGEAFFSVEKGSKFQVKTNNGYVEVLGTSFNVFNRNDLLNVHCETGRVAVKSSGLESILTPQQSVEVTNHGHRMMDLEESVKRSIWRKGNFVYKGALLFDVVAELERQFNITIQMDPSLGKIQYSGSFNKADLERALTEVFYPLNLQFDINRNSVTITR